jgi:hypothetical protein
MKPYNALHSTPRARSVRIGSAIEAARVSAVVQLKALTSELARLKSAFAGRQKPDIWVRDDLHPVDSLDATDFVRDIEAGKDRDLLFQSVIPYFAFLIDEARFFLLPDLLAILIPYPHEIVTKVCDFEDERGKVLLGSLAPAERDAVAQFIHSLSEWEGMRPYLDRIKELAGLVEASRTSQMQRTRR